eukprot:jgi/Tetstr1/466946/TSEL_011400.t1
MGTGVQNAPVDGPCHTPTSRGLELTLKVDVNEGRSPEPPDLKAEQPAKPAAGGPGWCRGQGGRWGANLAESFCERRCLSVGNLVVNDGNTLLCD